jgi:hypothetical protein
MSFLDDIVSVGSTLYKSISGSQIASGLAKTAVLGLLLNQVSKSMNKKNSPPPQANTSQPDRFVREPLSPSSQHAIPVVYGTAYVKGIITDAFLSNDNLTMYYCVTICEKTGTKLSDSTASTFSFDEIYWNDYKLNFASDGVTVTSGVDSNGNTNTNINGLMEIYCYRGGSSDPTVPVGYTNGSLGSAFAIFPSWSSFHQMSDLVFCIIKLTYNKEKDVTGLGNIEFKMTNSMTLPGDVMQDYMTNTRYGAGISNTEIYSA